MTITSEQNSVSYVAAGTAGEAFPVPMKFFEAADVFVYLDGILQTIGTNYTVSGGATAGGPAETGTVTWVGTPTATKTVLIIRRRASTQVNDYLPNDPLPANVFESVSDRLAMSIAAALRLSASDPRILDALVRRIANVVDPVNLQDAATKGYVDGKAAIFPFPSPLAGDAEKYLKAVGAASVGWFFPREVPVAANPGDDNKFLRANAGVASWQNQVAPVVLAPQNLAHNGRFRIAQRGVTLTDPDDITYTLDRWMMVCETAGGDVQVDQLESSSSAPQPDGWSCARLQVNNANKRFGFVQLYEERDSVHLRGQTVSMQFKAKCNNAVAGHLQTMRAAIIRYAGGDILITGAGRDPVSAWGAGGADFTPAAQWAIKGSAGFSLSTSYQTFKVEGKLLTAADVSDGAGVIYGLMVWCDCDGSAGHQSTIGDQLFLGDVMFEVGATASAYQPISIEQEWKTAERYFQKTYRYNHAPGTALVGAEIRIQSPFATVFTFPIRFATRLKSDGAIITVYNYFSGVAGTWYDTNNGLDISFGTIVGGQSEAGVYFTAIDVDLLAGHVIAGHYTADAEVGITF